MPQRWSFHFLISLGLAILNALILGIVFKLKKADGRYYLARLQRNFPLRTNERSCDIIDCLEEIGEEPRDQDPGEHSKVKQIFKQKNVHLLAFWGLAYVGLEFTIGGELLHIK